MLLFDLIDLDSNGVVSVESILSFLNLSYLQNVELSVQNENVIKEVFGNQSLLNKKSTLNIFIQNKKMKELLQAYLQIKSSDANIGLTSADHL